MKSRYSYWKKDFVVPSSKQVWAHEHFPIFNFLFHFIFNIQLEFKPRPLYMLAQTSILIYTSQSLYKNLFYILFFPFCFTYNEDGKSPEKKGRNKVVFSLTQFPFPEFCFRLVFGTHSLGDGVGTWIVPTTAAWNPLNLVVAVI